jgi:ubiquinone/menaquinone biosynthesis C-methylase UbiE
MKISETESVYNSRYDLYGRDLKTVGWGKRDDQNLRFEILLRNLDVRGKTILDVGCGLGDLVPYLASRFGDNFKYIGIDVARRLVEDARRQFEVPDRIEFVHGDIFSIELPSVDISLLSGALSLRVEGIEEYAERTLSEMCRISRYATTLNFLSKYCDYELEKNQHFEPEEVFRWARKRCRRVNLIHDYPLFEFTIQAFP